MKTKAVARGHQRRAPRTAAPTSAIVLAVMAVMTSACSSSKAKPIAASATSTAATTSTTTLAQVQAAIVSRWRAADEASVAVAKDPSNQALITLLVDFFVDPELSYLRTQYTARARNNLVDVGDVDYGQPQVASMTADRAMVISCETNRLALTNKVTGKPVPGPAGDPAPTFNAVTATLVVTPSGIWKVSDSTVKEGSCAK